MLADFEGSISAPGESSIHFLNAFIIDPALYRFLMSGLIRHERADGDSRWFQTQILFSDVCSSPLSVCKSPKLFPSLFSASTKASGSPPGGPRLPLKRAPSPPVPSPLPHRLALIHQAFTSSSLLLGKSCESTAKVHLLQLKPLLALTLEPALQKVITR